MEITDNNPGEHEKEGERMAVLAKSSDKISIIKKQESQKFVREFNENKVGKEFLDSCKKAGRLFERKK